MYVTQEGKQFIYIQETAGEQTTLFELPLPAGMRSIRALLDITTMLGTTPSLNVTIEDTLNDVDWNVVGTFTEMTATGQQIINIWWGNTGAGFSPIFGPRLRAKFVSNGADGVEPDPELTIEARLTIWAQA